MGALGAGTVVDGVLWATTKEQSVARSIAKATGRERRINLFISWQTSVLLLDAVSAATV